MSLFSHRLHLPVYMGKGNLKILVIKVYQSTYVDWSG
jgi:hypothetical protein